MNTGISTSIIGFWPVDSNSGYDLSAPNPWAGISAPGSPDPEKPSIVIRFSRAIDPLSYSSSDSLSQYFTLISLTHPSATNVTSFENISWNQAASVLSFRPSTRLVPGDIYLSSVQSSLRDSLGRGLDRNYSWTFKIDPATYQGLPLPVNITPVNESTVISVPALTWGIDPIYTAQSVPSGHSFLFDVNVYQDKALTQTLWHSVVPAVAASGTFGYTSPGLAYTLFTVTPTLPASGLSTGGLLYWTVSSLLKDASGSVTASTSASEASVFFLDIPPLLSEGVASTIGQATYSVLKQQNDPLAPLTFEVTGISPGMGYIGQDGVTSGSPPTFPLIAVGFSAPIDLVQLGVIIDSL